MNKERPVLYEVLDPQGTPMMETDFESCIDYSFHESMYAAGFRVKVAGKSVTKNRIKDAVQEALSRGIGHPKGEYPVVVRPVNYSAPYERTEPEDPGRLNPIIAEEHVVVPDLKVVAAPEPATVASVKTSKRVRCIETGKIYENQSAAARDLKIDPAQVSDSIKTGRRRSGYTFEKVEE